MVKSLLVEVLHQIVNRIQINILPFYAVVKIFVMREKISFFLFIELYFKRELLVFLE
jgi:hypothetical protein